MITTIDYDSEGRATRFYVAPNPPPQRRFLSCVSCQQLVLVELTDPWPRYVSYWQPPRRGKQAGLCVECFPDGPEGADPFSDAAFPFDAPGEERAVPRVCHVNEQVEGAVYVGRAVPRRRMKASPFANPFRIGRDGTREEVIEKYRDWLGDRPGLMAQAMRELAGKDLSCHCAPLACHAEVLLKVANDGG